MNTTISISDFDLSRAMKDIKKYSEVVQVKVKGEIKRTAYAVTNKAKRNLTDNRSVVTGNLRAQMNVNDKDINRFQAQSGTNVKYAKDVEFGTRPHIIKAKQSKYLHFKTKNGWVKKEFVNHPGSRPKPFLFPAAESERKPFINNITKILHDSAGTK